MSPMEAEIDILETISQGRWKVSQRDLARIIGISLGMTNAILKRLMKKGWLMVKKIKNQGFDGIVFVGKSDLGFIVEHACRRDDIIFISDEETENKFTGRIYQIYSESYIPDSDEIYNAGSCFLQELFV